ncbi:hypothetical protein TanjilG_15705, partial [Lupinus angustifolius]
LCLASRCYTSAQSAAATSVEAIEADQPNETVRNLLTNTEGVSRLMKMERKPLLLEGEFGESEAELQGRRFPYLDRFRCWNDYLMSSSEIIEAVSPCISDVRKERFRNVVHNRSYSVCLVVEGLNDFGNVSAAFRSADALGVQSVHVVSSEANKRYKDNRHVSMGAEKWLDIELWDSTKDCFKILKSRGYRIATTHVGIDAVLFDSANFFFINFQQKGISDEALELSDLHCSIPMNGMVDSFNVSVAAGILMHHAVSDRISRLGRHGDLTEEESRILLAEFSLRHSQSSISIVQDYAKRKAAILS